MAATPVDDAPMNEPEDVMQAGAKPTDDHIHVHFPLDVDEGWPPVAVEAVWAIDNGDGTARLDNVPFFAIGVAYQDLVAVAEDDAGCHQFAGVQAGSGHSTVRVIAAEAAALPGFIEKLVTLGCAFERSYIAALAAFDVPPHVDYAAIRAWLDEQEAAGVLDYEEGSLASQHAEAANVADAIH